MERLSTAGNLAHKLCKCYEKCIALNYSWCCKSSYLEVFFKEVAFKNFVKFSGKHLCRSLYCRKTLASESLLVNAQLHSTKPELRFCASSNPACVVWEVCDGEDLWQWPRLEIRLNHSAKKNSPIIV